MRQQKFDLSLSVSFLPWHCKTGRNSFFALLGVNWGRFAGASGLVPFQDSWYSILLNSFCLVFLVSLWYNKVPTSSFGIDSGACCHSPGEGERDAGELQQLRGCGLGLIICVDLRKEWGRKGQLTWCNLLIGGVVCYSSLLLLDTSACTKGLNPELGLGTFPVWFLTRQLLAAGSVNMHSDPKLCPHCVGCPLYHLLLLAGTLGRCQGWLLYIFLVIFLWFSISNTSK